LGLGILILGVIDTSFQGAEMQSVSKVYLGLMDSLILNMSFRMTFYNEMVNQEKRNISEIQPARNHGFQETLFIISSMLRMKTWT
jgi:hypothetical protein